MKTTPRPINIKTRLLLITAATAFWWMGWTAPCAYAQTSYTEASIPTSATEIATQELELKTKQLEFEKAKLELKQTEALDLRKAELVIEIKKLELLKARRDLMVQETKEQLAMLVEGDVMFDVNSAVIKAGATPTLNQVALILSEYPKGKMIVTGYADSTGTAQSNLELSRKRGESVKTYLLEKSNGMISSERVTAMGMGESQPVASNSSSAGRQLNRRVEITVTKL